MNLQEIKPNKKSIINHIYNTHHKYNKAKRDPRSRLQHLMKLLLDDKYVYIFGMVDNSKIFGDVFWVHSDSVKLFNAFPFKLGMDSTY